MTSFYDLLGIADNLGEEKPAVNNKPVLLGIVISFLVLALLCAILRIWCRIFIVRACGWDDFCLVLVMISISVGSIGACVAMDYGLGQHMLLLGPGAIVNYMKVFYICNGTLPISTTFIKVAILLQYLRTFERGTKSRTFTIIILVITAMWGTTYIFLAWVPCIPIAAYWDWSIPHNGRWGFGSQIAEELIRTYESHATSNMILDFIIFAIPLPLYFNNGANKKSRKSVLALFLLGSVVLMLSAWRLVELVKSRAGTYPTLDVTWYAPRPMVLSILEIDVAAICASLPVFWPMLQNSMGMIFVTREVKITTETVESPREDDDCLELSGPFSLCHQSTTMLNDTTGLIDPEIYGTHMSGPAATSVETSPTKETVIFGAYMQGKTTCDVEAVKVG
ncbi:integral membrane protein [Colletotrichum incanum]|uniref:Integral membrane protein n=1 Tax=Colletotrichum incanum TaxID=1573173 RepID=A0A161VYQ6_COLIC|nr:integral membrane protein [Colletotrichum incanum]OHW96110.1 integral membrane protein [Colletotrichum incanum]